MKVIGPRAVLSVVAAAIAALVLLAGCATHTGPSDPAAHARLTAGHSTATVRHTFNAYDASGRMTVAVTGHASGSCFSMSLAAPGTSAYRCFAGNQILDPCFARPGATGRTLACVADPWSKATDLTVTKALPHGSTSPRIWAFRRVDGARCVAATGTVPAVDRHNLDYHCSDGTFAALASIHARTVHAEFAKVGAATLRHANVRVLWSA